MLPQTTLIRLTGRYKFWHVRTRQQCLSGTPIQAANRIKSPIRTTILEEV
jgi:hypothetical protein